MKTMKVQLEPWAYMPERAYPTDAGADLRTPKRFTIPPKDMAVIDTGVHVEIPKGYAGFIKSKSGLMVNDGIIVDGLIDAGMVQGCESYACNGLHGDQDGKATAMVPACGGRRYDRKQQMPHGR